MKRIIPILALSVAFSLAGCAPDSMHIISQAWHSDRTWTPISWPAIPGCQDNSPSMPCMVPSTPIAEQNWKKSETRNAAATADKNWHKMTGTQRHEYRVKAKSAKEIKLEIRISQLPQLSHNAPQWLETYGDLQRAKSYLSGNLYKQLNAEIEEK